MSLNRQVLLRNVAEFAVLLALIVGGAVAVGSVPNPTGGSRNGLLQGVVLGVVACCGIGWLLWIGAGKRRLNSMMAGFGGGLGALVAMTYLNGTLFRALGAGLGAGLFAVGFTLWARMKE